MNALQPLGNDEPRFSFGFCYRLLIIAGYMTSLVYPRNLRPRGKLAKAWVPGAHAAQLLLASSPAPEKYPALHGRHVSSFLYCPAHIHRASKASTSSNNQARGTKGASSHQPYSRVHRQVEPFPIIPRPHTSGVRAQSEGPTERPW